MKFESPPRLIIYRCQPHMTNCEDLKVNNFENVIDLLFLIIIFY